MNERGGGKNTEFLKLCKYDLKLPKSQPNQTTKTNKQPNVC